MPNITCEDAAPQRVKTDRITLSHKNIWAHLISAEKYLKKESTEILDYPAANTQGYLIIKTKHDIILAL